MTKMTMKDDICYNLRTGKWIAGPGTVATEEHKMKFEYMIEHRGMKVILTDHARHQAEGRYSMPIEQMKKWFVQAIDFIKDTNFKPKYYNEEVFIFNRHFKRGMICAFRYDRKDSKKALCLVAVTVYPYGKDIPVYADTRIIHLRGDK